MKIFLSNNLNICFGCSKEGSFKYPQHMFWLRNDKTVSITVQAIIERP